MRNRFAIIIGVCLTLFLGGCGAAEEPGGQMVMTFSRTQSETSALPTDYPIDGWYEQININPRKTRAEQLDVAQRLADFAQTHGYPEARVLPHPGLPASCRGEPCLAVGPGPGEFLTILLRPDPLPGPDPTSAETSLETMSAFYDDILIPRNVELSKETASAGLTLDGLRQSGFDTSTIYPQDLHSSVLWMEFTVFEGLAPWDVNPPLPPATPDQ